MTPEQNETQAFADTQASFPPPSAPTQASSQKAESGDSPAQANAQGQNQGGGHGRRRRRRKKNKQAAQQNGSL